VPPDSERDAPADPHPDARAEVERASAHYYYSPAQLGIDARPRRS